MSQPNTTDRPAKEIAYMALRMTAAGATAKAAFSVLDAGDPLATDRLASETANDGMTALSGEWVAVQRVPDEAA